MASRPCCHYQCREPGALHIGENGKQFQLGL